MKKFLTLCCVLCLLILSTYSVFCKNSIVFAETNNTLNINGKSYILMDYETSNTIIENNSKTRLPIASMVKLMTLLLTYENIDNGNLSLSTMITTTENASKMGGSQVFIDPYVEYKTEDLIKSVIMASANDASVALAEHIAGSEKSFVELMNKRAKELKMDNTLYVNCTGLPAPEQYSCAFDCGIILKELLSHKHYLTLSSKWMDTLTHPSGRKTELVNTNKLVRYYKGCDSGKTGSTSEAGYCLSASCIKDNFRLIAIVIGANNGQERFNSVTNLFNYGFSNYQNKLIVDSKKAILKNQEVIQGKIKSIDVYAKNDYFALSKKGDSNEYKITYKLEKLKAPIKQNTSIGKLIITKEGNIIKEIDLVIKQDINKINYLDSLKKVAENW